MNKKIIIGFIALLLVGAIIAAVVVWKGDWLKEDNSDQLQLPTEPQKEKTVFDLATVAEVQEFANEHSYVLSISDDQLDASLSGVDYLSECFDVSYVFDAEGNASELSGFCMLDAFLDEEAQLMTSLSVEQLAEAVEITLGRFCSGFMCDVPEPIILTHWDGTFTEIKTDADYQPILDGAAYLKFAVRDRDGTYWTFTVYSSAGRVKTNITKYFDVASYLDYFANISLYEEKE